MPIALAHPRPRREHHVGEWIKRDYAEYEKRDGLLLGAADNDAGRCG
jgi:hypothetical protein